MNGYMQSLIGIILSAILTENFILVKFYGICPFMGVSKKIDTALGMGMAVTFVMAIASAATWAVNEYLLKGDLLSTLKYLLGYETWFRFIPVDCGLMLYKSLLGQFPEGKFTQRTNIDQNGAWNLDEQFGRDIVIDNRLANRYAVSEVDLTNLHERMILQIDDFLSDIDFSSGNFTFIFPPYSTLYWCDTQDQGYFDTFLEAKRYFVQELLDRNCTVYDFHSAPWANDLNNFQDSTHYCADMNDWMFDCFLTGDYMVTAENYDTLEANLIANTEVFRAENLELFG
jgi:hypothetical protein